ncbi:Slp family lipoprotein [uncultured Pluralibacter sp.]|uniref:Slp family lipoprotein n=1 Tax=uncultured Pluralibacter sp. TaxID=1490864 RepID=UPI002628B3A0|nr:Slp family lipoprotein [uncultured Pluralibacter sp.]
MASRTKVVNGLLVGLAIAVLSGCASVPESIRGTSATPQQDLVRVMAAPELYVGQEARFGGKVISVNNQPGKTRLEIATVPLDDVARPALSTPSLGRIYADVNGFLDPVDYRNQLVTVVGPITGTEKGKIGSTEYNYMVMQVIGYKRWRVVQQVMNTPGYMDPFWGMGPYPWHRGWGYGGWGYGGWYDPGPSRVESIVTE